MSIDVPLGARSYRVHVGAGMLDPGALRATLDETGLLRGACAIITDTNVGPLYAARVVAALSGDRPPVVITVPAGEPSKSFRQAEMVCDAMIAAGLDRRAFVLALGGGVVGDLAGFVAAIYYRGVPFIQVPTTVIAQVDSSVGGKTGINAHGGKNLIGAFHQPRAVVADVSTLDTLPDREFNEGFAEVIKHGIIRDAEMFSELASFRRGKSGGDPAALVARNVRIKAAIVAADEHETTGERALLNFGHTVGHAIENAAGYGRFLHGEAIALGLVAAADLSMRHAGLSRAEHDAIIERLEQFALPTRLPPEIGTDAIMAALRLDKKFAAGAVRFVLCPRIGSAFVSKEVTSEDIRGAVERLR